MRITTRRVGSLKHQMLGSKTRIVDERRGKNMTNMFSLKCVKRSIRKV